MEHFDIAVIGSGMGGSACALVLAKLGYNVLLIERGCHPRFAIGESATPVMSKKIRYLGAFYDIPEFDELSTYDKIKESNTNILCGPKELFHYFIHQPGQNSVDINGIIPEVIVQTPEVDAQFYRAESDEYMVKLAIKYGVTYMDFTSVNDLDITKNGVIIECERDNETFKVKVEFVIDGTGFKSIIGEKYKLKIQGDELDTQLRSRSIFSHFKNVGNFEEVLNRSPIFRDRSPAARNRATQHHCFNGGWLWFIPFENGVTSVGLNLDIDCYPLNDQPAEEEFWNIIEKFPIIHDLLLNAENVLPFIKTGRLQFINREMVGDRWAMLPASAYGLDAWFSTGLAVSFMAIHRLAELLDKKIFPEKRFQRELLVDYERALKQEFQHVSKMIHGIYKSFRHFDVFKYYCFLCFMGSENYLEQAGYEKGMDLRYLLLSAGDDAFIDKFNIVYDTVIRLSNQEYVSKLEVEALRRFIQFDMASYNFRDFGNPDKFGIHSRRLMAS